MKDYCHMPQMKPYLLENREEKRMIHQFNHKGQAIDLDNAKGKYLLNEIR